MKSTKLEDWFQIVGLFSVVGSLIFVGLQMKQAHQIALADIWQTRTAALTEASMSMASNELFISALLKGTTDRIEDITPTEYQAGYWVANAVMMFFENSHYQYTLGFLPDEHWQRVRTNIKLNLQSPIWGPWIRENSKLMQPSFRAIIEEIDQELLAEAGS